MGVELGVSRSEKKMFRVFVKRAMRGILKPKRDEVTRGLKNVGMTNSIIYTLCQLG